MNTFELLIKMLTRGADPGELEAALNWAKEELTKAEGKPLIMKTLTGSSLSLQVPDSTIKLLAQVEHVKFKPEVAHKAVVVILAFLQRNPALLDLLVDPSEITRPENIEKPARKRKGKES